MQTTRCNNRRLIVGEDTKVQGEMYTEEKPTMVEDTFESLIIIFKFFVRSAV